jgi:glycosyltransferase involved in cell wall biosynthesis
MQIDRELWVAGYPSFYGGADTELDHNIDLWRQFDFSVHLVPMYNADPTMRSFCDARGCRTHKYAPGIFANKVVISFCNGEFLRQLPAIVAEGRPRCVLWANCMTWHFDLELEAHRRGFVDRFLFQSRYQRNSLAPAQEAIRAFRTLEGYRPFFSLHNGSSSFSKAPKPFEYFGVGRISRDDPQKFHEETWRMFAKVCAPIPVKAFMLGFGEKAKTKCGATPGCDWLDWMYWSPQAIQASEFYGRIHVLLHLTGGSRENWPRAVLEAWASDVVPIVDADYGVREMVTDGVDGFHARSSDQAAHLASRLAFDAELREAMINAGRQTLMREHCNPERCIEPFLGLFEELAGA